MKFLFILFISCFVFGQDNSLIYLKDVEIVSYAKDKKFRPQFKKVERITDHTNKGLVLLSNLQLPKEKEIEIIAIEFLFDSKGVSTNLCNELYFFQPIIYKSINENKNLLENKWFVVDKTYKGKYIFPVYLKIKPSKAKEYLIGIESRYDNLFCSEANGYFDLIETKKKSIIFIHYKDKEDSGFIKQELFGHYSLNYVLYYK